MLRFSALLVAALLVPLPSVAQQCSNPNGATVPNCSAAFNSICMQAEICGSGDINSFTLTCDFVPPNKAGLFIYSNAAQINGGLVFGNGSILCIAGSGSSGLCRTSAILDSGASGTFTHTFNTTVGSGNCMIVTGQTWYFSTWYRDNGTSCSSTAPGTNFSNAWAMPL